MESVRIHKDITFQWQVRKDGRALTAADKPYLTIEICGRNGRLKQQLPFEIIDGKIVAVWYGVKQTEVGDYRLTCWWKRGQVGESAVDVVWAVTLVEYTTEETFDDLEMETIELEAGNLTFAVIHADVNAKTVPYDNSESELEAGNVQDAIDETVNLIPNEVVREAENAQFVHAKPNEQPIGLFYLRKVDSQLAGLMTAADKQKMDALPPGAVIPVVGQMGNNGFTFVNNTGIPLFTIPFADSTGGGLISLADLSRFMDLGTKQELDAQFALKADKSVVDAIQALIPAQASEENQLADKIFVNSSIATSTATFRGSFNLVADLSLSVGATHEQIAAALGTHIATADNNDYAFVFIPTSDATPTEIAAVERYKFNGTAWAFEYALNNSGFTAAQWAAINSGITALLVTKLQALPTASEISTALAAKEDVANKVTEIDDNSTDTQYGSAKAVWTAIKNAIASIKQWATNLFARTDGYYSRMIVGGAESLIGDVPQTATYTFRRTGGGAIGEPVARLTEIQGNTGVVNQLVKNGNFADGTTDWYSRQSGGLSVSNGIASFIKKIDASTNAFSASVQIVATHKIFYRIKYKSANQPTFRFANVANITGDTQALVTLPSSSEWTTSSAIAIADADYSYFGTTGRFTDVAIDGTIAEFESIEFIDLTLIYGAGYEPATVAEFEQRIWRDYGKTLDEYIAYTQGKLINCKALALESVGQNQFNPNSPLEELQVAEAASSVRWVIRTKVLAGDYYINATANTLLFCKIVENGVYGTATGLSEPRIITCNTNGGEIYIYSSSKDVVLRHLNDICINISDAAVNGSYRPYQKEVVSIPITTLTGINPTTGVREVMFPNGAGGGDGWRSALRVVNGATVAVKNEDEIDLGSLGWGGSDADHHIFRNTTWGDYKHPADNFTLANAVCALYTQKAFTPIQATDNMCFALSGAAASANTIIFINFNYDTIESFRAAMTGVKLRFQLAEPIIYTDILFADGTPFELPKNYNVQNDGTERITHAEGEDSIAPVMSAIYGLDAVGTIQGMPKDYTSQATLDGLIAKISAITGTTITKTWDAANNKWTFS